MTATVALPPPPSAPPASENAAQDYSQSTRYYDPVAASDPTTQLASTQPHGEVGPTAPVQPREQDFTTRVSEIPARRQGESDLNKTVAFDRTSPPPPTNETAAYGPGEPDLSDAMEPYRSAPVPVTGEFRTPDTGPTEYEDVSYVPSEPAPSAPLPSAPLPSTPLPGAPVQSLAVKPKKKSNWVMWTLGGVVVIGLVVIGAA